MGRLLVCIGCFFKSADHILTQVGRGMGRLLGCSGCFFQATDHILNQLGRGMGRLLGCSGCFHKGTDHILTQLGRGTKATGLHLEGPKSSPHPIRERNGKASLAASAAFSRAQIISSPQLGERSGKASGLRWLSFPEHRSYPHRIRERNGKAPWLHRLFFHGHRSYPHPIKKRNGKAPWLQRLPFQGHGSYPTHLTQLGREMGRLLGCIGCFFQDTDISSPN